MLRTDESTLRQGCVGERKRKEKNKAKARRQPVSRGGQRYANTTGRTKMGQAFERASKRVVHLSQLVEIYFIRRLNLSSVVTLDQATACFDTCNVSAHRVYVQPSRATLFMVQIAPRRLRCYSPLTRITARYFTPICQRDARSHSRHVSSTRAAVRLFLYDLVLFIYANTA